MGDWIVLLQIKMLYNETKHFKMFSSIESRMYVLQ